MDKQHSLIGKIDDIWARRIKQHGSVSAVFPQYDSPTLKSGILITLNRKSSVSVLYDIVSFHIKGI